MAGTIKGETKREDQRKAKKMNNLQETKKREEKKGESWSLSW
jgi:hypothetical protein